MSSTQDPARLIAERVARRFAAEPAGREQGTPTPGSGAARPAENRRARIIDFVSATPPTRTPPSIGADAESKPQVFEPASPIAPQVAQSPWLAPFSASLSRTSGYEQCPDSSTRNPYVVSHPSQERFGVDDAVVSELVEFFENEKKCSVDPSGKPCDHCAMCSSRGF